MVNGHHFYNMITRSHAHMYTCTHACTHTHTCTHTHAHAHTQVTTTLVSMCDRTTVDKNIEAAMRPLTLKEQTVMDEIMRRYFTPLQLTHWEGVEEEHKRQLNELNK